ncbi:cation diffusion facilitator family transporter [Thermus filiformis]|uniref:Cadmium transporter n=1 Tax=Thermus filiformis TaxID=276 RepID=A0A0A2X9A0_THEFI|nr:cation diffusion facilitator family transporter [Thermus filiformis]KGQ21759.1 cadmium transporter [Thermus filiformis]
MPKTALVSLLVGLLVFALKGLAYLLTGSVALLSDALESIVNVVAALAAYLALRVSAKPPDENHPFGHTKAEYFSAVFEGVLVVLAALSILREALPRLVRPLPLEGVGPGLLVSALAGGVNLALALYLIREGRRHRSPALVADGRHVLSDVLTSLGVLAGVGLATWTGLWVLDPLLALLVAVNILFMGFRLVRHSVGGLMDEGLPEEEKGRLEAALSQLPPGALEVHDVKTRRAGPRSFVELHLVVPGRMPVEEAHRLCDELEARLKEALPGVEVTIHVEPEKEARGPK